MFREPNKSVTNQLFGLQATGNYALPKSSVILQGFIQIYDLCAVNHYLYCPSCCLNICLVVHELSYYNLLYKLY